MVLPQAKLRVFRATLVNQLIELAQQGFIRALDPSELIEMSSVDMFYIVLKHMKSHKDKVEELLQDSEDFSTMKDYYARFDRLADFVSRVHQWPPLEQYNVLLKSMYDFCQHGIFYHTSHFDRYAPDLRNMLQTYLESLAIIAIDKTETNASMERYFKNRSKFYHHKDDPHYNARFASLQSYIDKEKYTNTIFHSINPSAVVHRQGLPPSKPQREWTEFLMSNHVYDMESYIMPEFAFPIIGTYFPASIRKEFHDYSPDTKAAINGFLQETDLNVDNDPRPHNDYEFILSQTEFVKATADKTVPPTPFPREFYENTDELPSDPNSEGKHKAEDDADTAEGSSSKKDKDEEDPTPTPPPPSGGSAPNVPDDTRYTPDSMLSARARDLTNLVNAMSPMDMDHDHMTRFTTPVELATNVSRHELRQTDYIISTKDRYGTSRYMVTFTRANRKPIFNIVR